ncbi:hypothetical protein BV25DRAFT_1914745 [Artomyces pyxidatus]|uniref:Uncharacterized protein n=1 Tax=Artomyces pyxidatus TaxID=48021 RepID=A0ACB8T6F7_9AGAM|nr:hypothetical protein BV25DRAFT_1914745 [Artomyces pyxidatus]
MYLSATFLPFALLSSGLLASCSCSNLEDYITKQSPISEDGVLRNTGARAGALPGVVAVATPVDGVPELAYTWIRDSAMVYNMWINRLTWGDTSLRPDVDDAVLALTETQTVRSPSGDVDTGGLAEPRFHLDLSPDLGVFSRPENDGPALRSIVLIKYANWLLENDNGTWVADELWPTIDLDLRWISQHWTNQSFELWETLYTQSFWTAAVQHRALISGRALGRKIKRQFDEKKYAEEANKLLKYMQSFWDDKQGFMWGSKGPGRNGIDSAAHLLSIFNYDQEAGCDVNTFQPCSDRALSSLKVTFDRFKELYPIAKDIPKGKPGPAGMYYEDPLGGGQPWFFSIFGAAEQLYDSLWTWQKLGYLRITHVSLPFFKTFSSRATVGKHRSTSHIYRTLTDAIRAYADEYVLLCAKYTPEGGALPEGFDKVTGQPYGAFGLSWSYAASLTAFDARMGKTPVSWGAVGKKIGIPEDVYDAPEAQFPVLSDDLFESLT